MTVHVVIKRKLKIRNPEKLLPLMQELSKRAQQQPGYISTETLQSLEDPEDFMVVSTWEGEDDWKKWFASKERREIQGQVDSLIGERTFYELFKPLG